MSMYLLVGLSFIVLINDLRCLQVKSQCSGKNANYSVFHIQIFNHLDND